MFKASLLQSLCKQGIGRGGGGGGGAHVGVGKKKMTQNIKILELEIGQLIVKFGGGGWVAMLCSMWGLSSPTRDQTHTPCTGSTEF